MQIAITNIDVLKPLSALEMNRDVARRNYFGHVDPGGLTPAQKKAWHLEHFALQLWLEAAQIKFDAECQMQTLLTAERRGAHV